MGKTWQEMPLPAEVVSGRRLINYDRIRLGPGSLLLSFPAGFQRYPSNAAMGIFGAIGCKQGNTSIVEVL